MTSPGPNATALDILKGMSPSDLARMRQSPAGSARLGNRPRSGFDPDIEDGAKWVSPPTGGGERGGEGSRGGKIIGHTKSGNAVYADKRAEHYSGWTADDHKDAMRVHSDRSEVHARLAYTPGYDEGHHRSMESMHREAATSHWEAVGKPGTIFSVKKADPLDLLHAQAVEDATSSPQEFQKAKPGDVAGHHKYIRRTGTPGRYQYEYADGSKRDRTQRMPEAKDQPEPFGEHPPAVLRQLQAAASEHLSGKLTDDQFDRRKRKILGVDVKPAPPVPEATEAGGAAWREQGGVHSSREPHGTYRIERRPSHGSSVVKLHFAPKGSAELHHLSNHADIDGAKAAAREHREGKSPDIDKAEGWGKDVTLRKAEGEGSRGGKVIGHTASGKAVYAVPETHAGRSGGVSGMGAHGDVYRDWSSKDHAHAAEWYDKQADHHRPKDAQQARSHELSAQSHRRRAAELRPKRVSPEERHRQELDHLFPGTTKSMTTDIVLRKAKDGSDLICADSLCVKADGEVGAKIRKLIEEGEPQKQAVAIALEMQRRGELGKSDDSLEMLVDAAFQGATIPKGSIRVWHDGTALVKSEGAWEPLEKGKRFAEGTTRTWGGTEYVKQAAGKWVPKKAGTAGLSSIEKAGGEGSRGGKIIGHTKSGKPVYAPSAAFAAALTGGKPADRDWRRLSRQHMAAHAGFTQADHHDAEALHSDADIANAHGGGDQAIGAAHEYLMQRHGKLGKSEPPTVRIGSCTYDVAEHQDYSHVDRVLGAQQPIDPLDRLKGTPVAGVTVIDRRPPGLGGTMWRR